jgi:hypothetical protein
MLRIRHLAPAAALALLFACTDAAKMPADAAIKGAESALAGAKAEAMKFVPDQAKAVQDGIDQAKAAFAKGDFKGALAAAKDLPAKAAGLAAAAAAKKDDLTRQFGAATGPVGQLVDAIKSRVDILSQAKKLPAGMDAGKLAAAKDGLAAVTKELEDAKAKMSAGSIAEALAAAAPLKDKAMEIASSIGLKF